MAHLPQHAKVPVLAAAQIARMRSAVTTTDAPAWIPPAQRLAIVAAALALTFAWYHDLIPGLAVPDLARLMESAPGRAWVAACGADPACVATVGTAARALELGVLAACAVLLGGTAPGAAVVAVALVSPLAYGDVLRPAGALDSVAIAALELAVTAIMLRGPRTHLAAGALCALVVTLADPVLAVAAWAGIAVATAMRAVPRAQPRVELAIGGASVAALGVRLAVTGGSASALGAWVPAKDLPLVLVEYALAIVIAAPIVLFVATKPGPRERVLRLYRSLDAQRRFIVTAAVVALFVAPFAANGGAVAYAVEACALLALAEPARRLASRPIGRASLAVGCASLLVAGVDTRWSPPAIASIVQTVPAPDMKTVHDALTEGPQPVAVTVVDGGKPAVDERYAGDAFFTLIAPGRVKSVTYVAKAPAEPSGPVFVAGDEGLTRVDRELRALARVRDAERHVRYDFVARFADGRINDSTPQQTPGGRGVMSLALPTPLGPRPTITVVLGFTYTFRGIPIEPGDRLVFAAGKMFPLGAIVRAEVRVADRGRTNEAVHVDVPPAESSGLIRWSDASVDLSRYAGRRIDVTFAVSTPTGNGTASWASFLAPAIVGAPGRR